MKPALVVYESVKESAFSFYKCNQSSVLHDWHFHNEFELHYVPDYAGEVYIGDYRGTFEPGTIFLIAPNLPHSWHLTNSNEKTAEINPASLLMHFSKSMTDRAQALFPEFHKLRNMLDNAEHGIAFLPSRETNEIGVSLAQLQHLHGCQKLGAFFTALEKLGHMEYQTLSSAIDDQNDYEIAGEPLNRALYFVNGHYDRDIDLETVAEIACMSPSYFCRQFKMNYGVSFLTYVNELRIDRMCTLLDQTEKPVSTICFEVGFHSLSSGNRRFRKRMKMSPSSYRSRCGNDAGPANSSVVGF